MSLKDSWAELTEVRYLLIGILIVLVALLLA